MSDEPEPTEVPYVDTNEAGQDMRLLQRALRNEWPITPDFLDASVKTAMRIALTSKSERNKLNAIKAMAMLNAQNITLAKMQADAAKAERVQPGEAAGNSGPVTVVLEMVDDYYGTAAAAAAAEDRITPAAPNAPADADSGEPGAG